MENSQNRFLNEILTKISALKAELSELERQVVEYQATLESAAEEAAPAMPTSGSVQVAPLDEDLPEAEAIAPASAPKEPEIEAPIRIEMGPDIVVVEPVVVEKDVFGGIVETEESASDDEDLPEAEAPAVSTEPQAISPEKDVEPSTSGTGPAADSAPALKVEIDPMAEILPLGESIGSRKSVVMDRMASHERWRTDIPGAPVSDIRSAISLNDRILFINTLFGEDPIAFKETLTALNGAASFEDGVLLLKERYPAWNTDSDTVYRFMMAVRRKLK